MKIDRRLVLIGVMLIVLSMTMATQYATTKIGYTFDIVHPSEADLRFIGSDNTSDDVRLLRVNGTNATNSMALTVEFDGNLSAGQNKTYTAAFGIVNEEMFTVNISYIDVDGINNADQYMQVWLHGDRDAISEADGTSILVFDKGTVNGGLLNGSTAWQLAAGDQDPTSMDGGNVNTPWDDTAHVRYSTDDTDAVNGTDDYVWVQISLDIPSNADSALVYSGTIYIYTRAATDT